MKTAVEWLVSQILTDIEKYNDDCTAVVGFEYFNKFQSHVDLSEYIEQAKEMEKERMIDFVKKFSDFNGITFNEKMISKEFLEKFYNETFKSE
jgi:hypothetical protein